ncbi:hypothetical protein LEN26_000273 [Aphanomyces euteiches]|nr:hypothetical protein AeMF1_019083 [Aphanomyces euteiches]KAH9163914.1 hypothetical protein LEN26_000273 [Aphanomyces euteiches]
MGEEYVAAATPGPATPPVEINPLVAEETTLVVGEWKAGLFSCFDNLLPNCLCSCFCPCITLGQIVARLGVANFIFTAVASCLLCCTVVGSILVFLGIFFFRTKFRKMLRIPGSDLEDCCASFWCSCCVLAQLATHTGSYTPGSCTWKPKDTLPGYSTMLLSNAEPVAVPVAEPPSKV